MRDGCDIDIMTYAISTESTHPRPRRLRRELRFKVWNVQPAASTVYESWLSGVDQTNGGDGDEGVDIGFESGCF